MIILENYIASLNILESGELKYLDDYITEIGYFTEKESIYLINLLEQTKFSKIEKIKNKFKKRIKYLEKKYNIKMDKMRKDAIMAKTANDISLKNKILLRMDDYKKNFMKKIKDLNKKYYFSIKNVKKQISKRIIKLKPSKGTAIAIGVGSGIGSYTVYRNYMSKAARYCAGKTGVEKKNCMNKYKELAKKAK